MTLDPRSARVALDTVGPPADAGFAACPYAEGKQADAPACSAAVSLEQARRRFQSEAIARTFDAGRYRMPFRVWGTGSPLVFVPGMCDDARSFVLLLARLSGQFCCVAYDLPSGRGDGARLGRIGPDDLVADLVALCDHLGFRQANLLGASFGSTVVLRALAAHADRFPTAVLQGGFAHRPLAFAEVLLARAARWWPGRMRQLPGWRPVLQARVGAEFAGVDPARWQYLLDVHGDAGIAPVARRALWIHATDLRPLLATIQQRVLLVVGERDVVVGQACAETLLRGLPHALRAEIEGAGHLPQFTHPEVFCEIVEQFLLGGPTHH